MLCSQNITTIIGNTYNLSYYLWSSYSYNFQFNARINGNIVSGSSINTNSSFIWTLYSFNFIATTSTTTISFYSVVSISYPQYANFDNVTVIDISPLTCFTPLKTMLET
jgi:hypothetical protein